jgi:FeS assembly protein IscX
MNMLYWDATYEIVLELRTRYPNVEVESVGLLALQEMIVSLPNFADEPAMAPEGILESILGEWYEEANT